MAKSPAKKKKTDTQPDLFGEALVPPGLPNTWAKNCWSSSASSGGSIPSFRP
jgi:hypothetical protein